MQHLSRQAPHHGAPIVSHSSRAAPGAPRDEFGFPLIDMATLHLTGKPLKPELIQPTLVMQEIEAASPGTSMPGGGKKGPVLDIYGMTTEFAAMVGIPTERPQTPFARAFPGMYAIKQPSARIKEAERRLGRQLVPAERSMLLQYLYKAGMPPVVQAWETFKARVQEAQDRARDVDTLRMADDAVRMDYAEVDRKAAAKAALAGTGGPQYPIE